jgi:hypothetical protein
MYRITHETDLCDFTSDVGNAWDEKRKNSVRIQNKPKKNRFKPVPMRNSPAITAAIKQANSSNLNVMC